MTGYKKTLYKQLADELSLAISDGIYTPDTKLPSVRVLSKSKGVSVSTVLEAYRLLEDRGFIEVRPQSGYYVMRDAVEKMPSKPSRTELCEIPTRISEVTNSQICEDVIKAVSMPGVVRLGCGLPDPEFFPCDKISKCLSKVVRTYPEEVNTYSIVPGREELRNEIARHAIDLGCFYSPEDIVITNGSQEAILLALRCFARPGDVIAVESPGYFGFFSAMEFLGLKAVEISSDPHEGLSIDSLEKILAKYGNKIKGLLFSSSVANPTGAVMSDENKKRLAELLSKYDLPAIDDCTYSYLYFGTDTLKSFKAYYPEKCILVNSFSKILSPGYRIGWAAPGIYYHDFNRHKSNLNLVVSTNNQLGIANYLQGRSFYANLRKIKRTYENNIEYMTRLIFSAFPDSTKLTSPKGGHYIWVKLPDGVNSLDLHYKCLNDNITICPGLLFSPAGNYNNYIRINCALRMGSDIDDAIFKLAAIVKDLLCSAKK